MENNQQIKWYPHRCRDNNQTNEAVFSWVYENNRQLKLHYLVFIDNNRKMVLYSLCAWKITDK
jgi:hypothetical protein